MRQRGPEEKTHRTCHPLGVDEVRIVRHGREHADPPVARVHPPLSLLRLPPPPLLLLLLLPFLQRGLGLGGSLRMASHV